jgi:hypothetical protein
MAYATQDLYVTERSDYEVSHPVAAAAVVRGGTIVGGTVVGALARPYQVGDIVLGVSIEAADNTGGAAGAKRVTVRKGCFGFQQNGTITRDHIGKFCKPVDDSTVAIEAVPGTATANTCGTIADIEGSLVFVEFRRFV